MARSRTVFGALLLCAAALSCNGGAEGDVGGTGDADGTAADTAGSDASGSADDTDDGSDGTGTGAGDCDPIGPWSDPPAGPYLISKRSDGTPATGGAVSLSGDGRHVAFASRGDPLGDTFGNLLSIYIYDAECDTVTALPYEPPTEPVTESLDPVISADGSTIVFVTVDAVREAHLFVADLASGAIDQIDVDGDGAAVGTTFWHYEPSDDGRVIAFIADRPLVPEDTNENLDVYVLDRDSGELELVCPPNDPPQNHIYCTMPTLSADGRLVAYERNATVYLYDRETGVEEEISRSPEGSLDNGASGGPSLSGDGRLVAFHSDKRDLVDDDTNTVTDVFVLDRDTEAVTRVSVDEDGQGLVGPSVLPEISADGSVIVFVSGWYGAAEPQAQIFAHDTSSGTTRRITDTATGEEASAASSLGKISADGRWAAFETTATNLLPDGQPSGGWNAFLVALP